ncbi:MAG TPA: mechanosensitive ion channel family protein [Opitutaceae bacterium]|nr:mechanosensitive ion channel family protein [Opitutaceae bacterium]
MKRLVLLLFFALTAVQLPPLIRAEAGNAAAPPASAPVPANTSAPASAKPDTADDESRNKTAAAAAVVASRQPRPAIAAASGFIENVVDSVLEFFSVGESGNALAHYGVSAFFLLLTLLLRRVLTEVIFRRLRQVAARTRTTLDDQLLPVLEAPVGALIGVFGIFCALDALKFSEQVHGYIGIAATIAFSLVIFWGLFRAFNALLDHLHHVARERQLSIAPFMPWLKKTLIALFVIVGVLLIADNLGANVRAFLAGLGIGGLAFALAAQDTIANLFGSVVVALDQPFKIGDTVQIAAVTGTVEDIGLRSTKLRAVDRSLVIIPNKTVAAETINNLSRFSQRRVEQVIGLTYDTTPEQMAAMIDDIRQLVLREPGVDPASVMVYFRDFSASSLDLWLVYLTREPDFAKQMALRERINLALMKAVAARGLSFAFPTSVMHLDGPVARQLAGNKG